MDKKKNGIKYVIYILLIVVIGIAAFFILTKFHIIPNKNSNDKNIADETDFIEISNLERFIEYFYNDFDEDANYRLTADIDLSNYCRTNKCKPIGSEKESFAGIFDGNNHTINGLKIQTSAYQINDIAGGLFASLYGGTIKNLKMTDFKIYSEGEMVLNRAGALAGSIYGGVIENCHVEGSIEDAGNYVGLLVGDFSEQYSGEFISKIINSSAKGSISNTASNISNPADLSEQLDSSFVGGLVGKIDGSTRNIQITNCETEVNIDVFGTYIGGLIGDAQYAEISMSLSSGTIKFTGNYVGGLIGTVKDSSISKSSSNIELTTVKIGESYDGLLHVGELIGFQENTEIKNN